MDRVAACGDDVRWRGDVERAERRIDSGQREEPASGHLHNQGQYRSRGHHGDPIGALTDPSLPCSGPGRASNGNFALDEVPREGMAAEQPGGGRDRDAAESRGRLLPELFGELARRRRDRRQSNDGLVDSSAGRSPARGDLPPAKTHRLFRRRGAGVHAAAGFASGTQSRTSAAVGDHGAAADRGPQARRTEYPCS